MGAIGVSALVEEEIATPLPERSTGSRSISVTSAACSSPVVPFSTTTVVPTRSWA